MAIGETLAERYEQTLARIELLTSAGYTVKVQWECEFEGVADDDLQRHPIVRHAPMNTRDALNGGRTEAMRLHYKIKEGEESVQYCDIMSLYPYICKYFKFPIGRPIIHVGDICADIEACLKMEGLMKCRIVPPTKLYHPVQPYRYDKKQLFCLCRTCVHEHNGKSECRHRSVAERCLEGTWVLDEVRLAVDKGYEILEILEVTRYDPDTGNGGLFAEYIDTCEIKTRG